VKKDGPRVNPNPLTPLAQEYLAKMQAALENEDGDELANIVFDAEIENDVAEQIDLKWYEQKAASLIQK